MAIEFRLPELGEKIKAGDVVKVLVAEGDVIAVDQPVLEMETDKAVIEVPSSVAGKVSFHSCQRGRKSGRRPTDPGLGGRSSLRAEEGPEAVKASPNTAFTPKASTPAIASSSTIPASPTGLPVAAAPSVRQLAREIGVDIAQVPGNGPGGRISIEDVKKYAKQLLMARPAGAGSAPAVELPDFSKWGSVTREPMSNVRRKTAEQHGAGMDDDPARHAVRLGKHHGSRGAPEKAGAKSRKVRREAYRDGDPDQDRGGCAEESSRSSTPASTWQKTKSS